MHHHDQTLKEHAVKRKNSNLQPIFDTNLQISRKLRALRDNIAGADFLMLRTADDLADRLATVERHFATSATILSPTGHTRQVLEASGKAGKVTEIVQHPALPGGEGGLVAKDEVLPLDAQSIELAVSLLALHDINDLPGLLLQIRRALKPDGLFLAALMGADTLKELRESLLAAEVEIYGGAAPRVSPFTDVRDAGALLQRARFALPVADVETITVRYPHLFALMADLRAMGATSSLIDRSRRPGTRRLFSRAAEIYADRFSDPDGRIRATFSIVWLSGWAPDPSQQKPLKPGSAQVSLSDALKNF